jgi:hypothetical protein
MVAPTEAGVASTTSTNFGRFIQMKSPIKGKPQTIPTIARIESNRAIPIGIITTVWAMKAVTIDSAPMRLIIFHGELYFANIRFFGAGVGAIGSIIIRWTWTWPP